MSGACYHSLKHIILWDELLTNFVNTQSNFTLADWLVSSYLRLPYHYLYRENRWLDNDEFNSKQMYNKNAY